MTTPPADHVSIGEVLAALRDEFPDITISKIRFLESQGLIDPERTPSGYRKFYPEDLSRLRWILFQQKENFLPLKIIKTRLEQTPKGQVPSDASDETTGVPGTKTGTKTGPKTGTKSTAPKVPAAGSGRAKGTSPKRAAPAAPTAPARRKKLVTESLALDDGAGDDLAVNLSGASLTRSELAKAAGMTDAQIAELEGYGLLTPVAGHGDRVLFDEEALTIAQLAAEFAAHGIEPRHLGMYKNFAGREASLFGQVVRPVLRQRNPEARSRARTDLVNLARLGRAMRAAFLRSAASDLLAD